MKHWLDPNDVAREPHGYPDAANGVIVVDGTASQVSLAAACLVMDSNAYARAIADRLASDLALGRICGGPRADAEYTRIANQLHRYAQGIIGYTPDFLPLVLRANLLPRRVLAAAGELGSYARKLLAVSQIDDLRAPDFILEVGERNGSLRVVQRLSYIAKHSSDVESAVVGGKLIMHDATSIMKRVRDGTY